MIVAGAKEQRLTIPFQTGIPPGKLGWCTQNAWAAYKANPKADIYVGTVVQRAKYEEAKQTYEKSGGKDWSVTTEAIPHAWNVVDGKIADHTLGSQESKEYLYFGFKVPPDQIAKMVHSNDLAGWHLRNNK